MDQQSRIDNIKNTIKNKTPYSYTDIKWNGKSQKMPVYEINLSYLIYNKFNGRIQTKTKSIELAKDKKGKNLEIEADTPKGKELLEKLLMESAPSKNKKTEADLKKYGQMDPGVITRDGIILSGNRRAMLLNRIEGVDSFKAVVLDVEFDRDPKLIRKYEATYQMAEDSKQDYPANEKYLMAYQLIMEDLYTESQVAEMMGEKPKSVKKLVATYQIMERYLKNYGYDRCYAALDLREEGFRQVEAWMSTFLGKESLKGFDGYTDVDVEDLILISFDYIRAVYENPSKELKWEDLRILAGGQKENNLFGDQEIWVDFATNHFEVIKEIIKKENEEDIIDPSMWGTELEKKLKSRDAKFSEDSIDFLTENFIKAQRKLNNKKDRETPHKIVTEVLDDLRDVSKYSQLLKNDENSLSGIRKIISLSEEIVSNSSTLDHLRHINQLLEKTNTKNIQNKEDIKEQLKKIQKTAYNIEKHKLEQ